MILERIEIIQGDITKIQAEAVVNAANTSLLGGGGVDGAIHRAGGSAILDDCRKIRNKQGKCKTGEAVITTAGNLPANYVIHTVGPVWNTGSEKEKQLLASAYKNSLLLAVENNIKTIVFPNISTGVYCFPEKEAADIAIDTVIEFLKINDTINRVIFCCFDSENYNLYKEIITSKKL